MNKFHAWFDNEDFSENCNRVCHAICTDNVENVNIKDEEVTACFRRVNPNKSPGPDGLHGRVLKTCATQLGPIFARIFQMLLNAHMVPKSWKMSTVIPVPKMSGAKLMKDFRPIALTSILSKCMERIVSNKLTLCVKDSLDPFQFAYRAGRGVEDATVTLVHHVTSHLDQAGTSARILFMDMSAAFNTIQHYILLEKLLDLQVNPFIILWIREFLRDRTQRVCLRLKHPNTLNIMSDTIIVNSGTPQGCILSYVLFSLYINDIKVVLDLV